MRNALKLSDRRRCWYYARRDVGTSNMNVPDQQLDPPEPKQYVTWDEYLEHEADRLNDEEKERQNDNE